MITRNINKDDYKTINKWRMDYGITPIPDSWFSSTGFIIDDVACIFMYTTNSSMVFLEFLTGNPKIESKIRKKAIEVLVKTCNNKAKELGYKYLWGMIEAEVVKDMANELGFLKEDKSFNFMYKGVL